MSDMTQFKKQLQSAATTARRDMFLSTATMWTIGPASVLCCMCCLGSVISSNLIVLPVIGALFCVDASSRREVYKKRVICAKHILKYVEARQKFRRSS